MQVLKVNLDKSVKVGVSLPLNGNAVFNQTYSHREQIKSNLTNFLLTNKGEKLFKSEFGTNIRKKLFEPITNLDNFQDELRSDINKYFIDQLTIVSLKVVPDYDGSLVEIVIEYILKSEFENDIINLRFQ
jgi:phage baseplate assembly protein W